MELSVKMIYDQKIEIRESVSSWPRKDDCWRARIIEKDGTEWECGYLPKTVYSLYVHIRKLADQGITRNMIAGLIELINVDRNYYYEVGSNDTDADSEL